MTAPSLIARQLRTAGRAFRSWLKVWASSPLLHACRLSTGAATAGIASMVVIGTTGAMLGVSPSLAQEKHRADFVTGSVDDSVLTQALDALRRNGSVTPRSLTVRNGETLSSLLARLEVVDPQAVFYIRSQRMLRPLVMPQDGQYVNAGVLPDGRLAFLHLYLEGPHPQDSRRIEVTRTGELFAAAEYPVAFDTLEEGISGVAPSGSRIFAAADGVVTFVGYERKGYGRYVKIDHGLGRTTLYAHMSRITKNLRAGQKVERGDVIGYVGRTGLATGPHLHYELMFDGVQINPRTADLPDTENLTAFQVAQLKTIARPIQARFDLLAESESLPVPTVLRTHRDDATAVAKHLLGDEEQAEGASRVAHRVTSMKED